MKTMNLILLVAVLSLGFGVAHAADGRAQFDAAMNEATMHYLVIGAALAADRTDGVNKAAKQIEAVAAKLKPETVTGDAARHYRMIAANLGTAARELAQATTIEQMREKFKALSQPMAMWAHHARPDGVNVVYCSMFKGSWLQEGAQIRNPYYGAAMPTCGEIIQGPDHGAAGGHMQHH